MAGPTAMVAAGEAEAVNEHDDQECLERSQECTERRDRREGRQNRQGRLEESQEH